MRPQRKNGAGSGVSRSRTARDSAAAHRWAIVLAAGEGSRLSSITRDRRGDMVPKQFCSLNGTSTLLDDALARAHRVAPPERTIVIVAADQEHHWRDALAAIPADNIVVQPRNRGTAPGILLPTLTVMSRDTDARIVCLPSDHFVADEEVLADAVDAALADVERRQDDFVFLGIEPDMADPGLGYIAPVGRATRSPARIERFIEKPDVTVADALIGLGALWNSFIFAATGHTILQLIEERIPTVVRDVATAMQSADAPAALACVYERMRPFDFSRHVVEGSERRLRVLAVPSCGWSDLGTPERLGECLDRFPIRGLRTARHPFRQDVVNLADAYRCFVSSPALGSVA